MCLAGDYFWKYWFFKKGLYLLTCNRKFWWSGSIFKALHKDASTTTNPKSTVAGARIVSQKVSEARWER